MLETKLIETIVDRIQEGKPERTLRGIRFNNLEFIFSPEKELLDPHIIIKGKKTYYLRSMDLRDKLISVYNKLSEIEF